MARGKEELQEEAISLGIEPGVVYSLTSERIMDQIRDIKCEDVELTPQVEVMLCKNTKDYFEYALNRPWQSQKMNHLFWDNDEWVVEEKMDETRVKMHFLEGKVRIDSRRRSDVSYAYVEKTKNFPQFNLDYPDSFEGRILDGGIYMSNPRVRTADGKGWTTSTRASSVSVANSKPEAAIKLQQESGFASFCIYDLIPGPNQISMPYGLRYAIVTEMLHVLVEEWNWPTHLLYRPRWAESNNKLMLFEEIMKEGGEGIIFKNLKGKYEKGKRSRSQWKLKRFGEVDCFISGFKHGQGEFEGYVGALQISIIDDKGNPQEISAVSQMDDSSRRRISMPNGDLKDEYYSQVVSVRYETITKNKRLGHAVLIEWRPDKKWNECTGYELERTSNA